MIDVRNYKKIFLVLIIIILIFLVVKSLLDKKNNEEKITDYIISNGFSEDAGTLYKKQISDINYDEYSNKKDNGEDVTYEMLYFNTNTYELTLDKIEFSNGIEKSFNPVYNYVDETLTYNYRINIDNTNVIINGEYIKDSYEFSCSPTFSYQFNTSNALDKICEKIREDVEDFYSDAITLIKKPNLIDKDKKES